MPNEENTGTGEAMPNRVEVPPPMPLRLAQHPLPRYVRQPKSIKVLLKDLLLGFFPFRINVPVNLRGDGLNLLHHDAESML